MLQRLLGEFLKIDGVEQAMMMDDRGKLLSSVGTEGQLPPVDRAVELTVAALDAVQNHDQGDMHELWIEGEDQVLIDILTPYRIVMLAGTKGNIARWRHSMDHLRPQLATTQEM
ncbi:MAG: hypothetical protein QF880_01250 [Candidatus Poseidonia sp.]|jgi:hypothetical protein|nr:hypothetical protein [Poseidonia sp.]RJU93859.1 MAG: hypothetical protein DWC03_03905 [Candidatus Poseidoniales archaeon]